MYKELTVPQVSNRLDLVFYIECYFLQIRSPKSDKMATTQTTAENPSELNPNYNPHLNSTTTHSTDYANSVPNRGPNSAQAVLAPSRRWHYTWQGSGGNPLAHINTGDSARLPAFSGALQPGVYKPPKSNIANPAPLGLAAFAFTTFLLSLINWHTRSVTEPSIVIGPAFAYGGLVQLLAGMW